MDIERANVVLVKAIAQLRESEIERVATNLVESKSDMMPLIRAWEKKHGKPFGKWSYNKDWGNYVRWVVKPHKDGIHVRVERRDKNEKSLSPLEHVINVDALGGGEYDVYVRGRLSHPQAAGPTKATSVSRAVELLDKAWSHWRDD